MHVTLLHDRHGADAPPEAQDTLLQAESITAALQRRGHTVTVVAVSNDLGELHATLRAGQHDVVFNLVESLAGVDAAAVAVPALVAAAGKRLTGCHAHSTAWANDKVAAKQLMCSHGIPTASFITAGHTGQVQAGSYIIKARFEHASKGLDETCIQHLASADEATRAILDMERRLSCPCFAEQFIDGREFNLSVLEHQGQCQVLPPAEIDFSAFPLERRRIVGYAAKWHSGSFEYENTPRRFDFTPADDPLLNTLSALAANAWGIFSLNGYARVDFRVGVDGPKVLEVNANPCLTPDAGFAAAAARAGIDYDDLIERIMLSAN